MINCQYLNYNELVVFGTIASEKDDPLKTTLLSIIPRVAVSYNQYLNNFPTLQSKVKSDIRRKEKDEKKALKHCYSTRTQSFKVIRAKIFDIQPNILKANCPYCLLTKPTTLDHYIGQTEFPEYAILIKNLIPCCYPCNKKKDENWRENKIRRYIHFYNDNFLNHRFLQARLVYRRGALVPTIVYYISKPVGMNADDFRIVKFHFKDLDLLEDYNLKANTLVSAEIDVMKDSFANGVTKAVIVSNLLKKVNSLSVDFGVNYWYAIMYETLAQTRKLINSL